MSLPFLERLRRGRKAPSTPLPEYYHYDLLLAGEKVGTVSASPNLPTSWVLALAMESRGLPPHHLPLYSLRRYV